VRRGLAAALVATLASLCRPAAAGPRRVAILDLVTEGVAPDVRAQFETTIEEELRKAGAMVVANAAVLELVHKRLDLPDGCTFGRCIVPIAAALAADRLLDARITADGASYTYVLSLIEPQEGAPVAQVVATCGVCTVAEALGKMAGAVKALEGQALPYAARDTGPIQPMRPAPRSKALPLVLVAGGLALAAGGSALVAGTEQKEAGWVTIGSGGTALLMGLILLLTGD